VKPELEKLHQRLLREHDLRERTLETLLSLGEAIRGCDPAGIQGSKARLQSRLHELEEHRIQRDEALATAARAVGITTPGATLSSILERAPEKENEKLETLAASLRSLAIRTKELNQRNLVMLRGGLDVVDGLLSAFLEPRPAPETYGRSGETNRLPRDRGFLDARA
jgi:flagellar biosynthesis/type III secretory pathway chaperone